jgi:GDP/UDP-N,N'-diacetylbacillosamine 2-epimerase (hydrolysing)
MKPVRKICYVTGTRADFGLMQSTLQLINRSAMFELSILVTGMHLSHFYGLTIEEIRAAGLPVTAQIEVEEGPSTGALMARNVGRMLIGLTDALEKIRPDAVMILGDRGEMLAGALAAIHLDIPVVHIHGGERSGTVDEPVRHAISKLANFHFAATGESKARLVRMGEVADHVHVVGAPGLDGLKQLAVRDRATLCAGVGFDPADRIALMVYHPVLQEAAHSREFAGRIVDALRAQRIQVLALQPNSDAGSTEVRAAFEARAAAGEIHLVTHLPRAEFVSWMAACDVMVGNSSSGIIEAATFGTPVVNVGSRQNLRERNANVIDTPVERAAIDGALARALGVSRLDGHNVYGDGRAGERIVALLERIDLSGLTAKTNVY